MTNIQERVYVAEDLQHFSDDGKRRELLRGAILEMSPTNEIHGVLTLELAALIREFVRPRHLGRLYAAETGFLLASNPDTVLAPDIAYISVERAKPLTEKFVNGAPDLAVEVISPGNSADEMNEKIDLYFRAGTRQIWIVYPKTRTIYVYSAANKVTILGISDSLNAQDILPGFQLSLQDLFSILD